LCFVQLLYHNQKLSVSFVGFVRLGTAELLHSRQSELGTWERKPVAVGLTTVASFLRISGVIVFEC
jgi:hypothetical protein